MFDEGAIFEQEKIKEVKLKLDLALQDNLSYIYHLWELESRHRMVWYDGFGEPYFMVDKSIWIQGRGV